MAGQMGMEEPFYNDRPMILQAYYKYAIIFRVYNKYCVLKYGTMYYHVHIFNIMEFKNIRSVWNGRSNENGIAFLQRPTYGSSRLLQILPRCFAYNKYCMWSYGAMLNSWPYKENPRDLIHPVISEWPLI